MFISWRAFLVCAALRLLNLAWTSSDQIWPPTQVLCKESARNELGNLKNNITAVASISEFDGFIKKTMLWVDKSLLIKAIFEREQDINKDLIWVTSSPRWGKTVNLNMFAFYCELYTDEEGAPLDREKSPAYQYFVNGFIVENGKDIDKTYPQPPLISSYKGNKKHLANYAVIRLHGGKLNMETGISSIRTLIHEAYQLQTPLLMRLRNLSTSDGNLGSKYTAERNLDIFESYYDWNKIMDMDSSFLLMGIRRLCDILKSTYDRMVVIVFDDYDHFIHAAYFGDTRFQSTPETLDFQEYLSEFMLATFKDNPSLKKALITGILSTNEETYVSGINPRVHWAYISDYDNIFPFYGIFDWELEKMMEFRGLDTKNFDVQSSLESDGFRSLANLTAPMFSTYSVANFINSAHPRVISHHPTGCIVNILTKMLNQPEFQAEMLNFVEKSNDTLAGISYKEFHSLRLEDCELVNELMHGVETYDSSLRHEDVMFSLLLKFGLATVAKHQKYYRGTVYVKIPYREAMDYITGDANLCARCARAHRFIFQKEKKGTFT